MEFPDPPPRASQHCRFYSYDPRGFLTEGGGPHCARGVDLSEPGSAMNMCMPYGGKPRGLCSQREDWTEGERVAFKEWSDAHLIRCLALLEAVPDEGSAGVFECPSCGGKAHFTRAPRNGHIHAGCRTKNCSGFMQ